jgi:tetratricopeptide (TPR) repeat protein
MFDIFGAKDPQKALQRATEYVREGKVGPAIKVLEDNLIESEESVDLYIMLAKLYFDAEERGRAVNVLKQLKSFAQSRTDEIVATLSELYYQHASIDTADFLLQLHIEQQRYDELSKVLRNLSDREVKLLVTRYEKLKQTIDSKNVVSKKDFDNIIILATVHFFADESEQALAAIEHMIDEGTHAKALLGWARIIGRERYTDWRAGILLARILMANRDFEGALTQAQRIAEKHEESFDSLMAIISAAKPPAELEAVYAQFMTELYIKKGDLDSSTDLLLDLLKNDPAKSDDVIKGLRELERINPGNLKILYALNEAYTQANRMSLAVTELNKILEVDPGQFKKVIKHYEEVFKKEPNNPQVIEGLVNAYLSKNDTRTAVVVIEKAYANDPGLLDEYVVNLNAVLEKNIDNPKALHLLGLCYAHKGEHDDAQLILENLLDNGQFELVKKATDDILEESPDDLVYINLKARSMVELGEEVKAFALLGNFIRSHPGDIAELLPTLDTLVNKQPSLGDKIVPLIAPYKEKDTFVADLATARAYAFSGNNEKAVKLFEKLLEDKEKKETVRRAMIEVIQSRPQAVPLLLAAARIFMKEGEVEIATRFFKTAQMVDPKAFFEIVDEFYDALKAFPKDREVRKLLVDTFFHRKLWERVIEESKHAIDVFGRDEAQYFNLMLGQALVEKGNLSDAVRPLMLSLDGPDNFAMVVIEYLDKILNIDKSNVPAHFARGRALSRAHRIDEAVEEYLLTVRILPARAEYVYDELKALSSKAMANPLIIFAMGSVELVLKQHDDAIKHLLQACELEQTLVKRVIPQYEKLTQSASSPLLDFSLARAYHLAGLKSSAVKYYMKAQAVEKSYREPSISEMKKICAESPDDIESQKALAELYLNYNNLEDSLDLAAGIHKVKPQESDWSKKFVSTILKKDPKHIPSYYFLGRIFLKEDDEKKAVDVYKKLLEIEPAEITNVIAAIESDKQKSDDLILYLGSLYKDTGDIKKAITVLSDLFTHDPSYGDAISYQIKEVLKRDANMTDAYLLAHKIFLYQKEYERALEAIRHARSLAPSNEGIVLIEGQTFYEMGEPEKAIKLYTELLTKTKDRTAIYRLIRKTRKQYFTEKIESIQGDSDKERLKRAELYLSMNDLSKSQKELQFTPHDKFTVRQHALLRARFLVKKGRPIDALEIMKDLPVDEETASIYADIYEAMGSYEAAALVLRQAGITGVGQRIAGYEKLAQERRLAKGRYFIEGRS